MDTEPPGGKLYREVRKELATIIRNLPKAPEPTRAYHTPDNFSGVPRGRLENDGMGADREKQKWTDEEKEELIRLRLKKELSFDVIAAELGRSKASVMRMVFRLRQTEALQDDHITFRKGRT